MFVYNNFTTDARVQKEAVTLTAAGFEVQVVAVLDKKTTPTEERDGFAIVRIDRNPLHYRLLRRTRLARRWLRLRNARLKRNLRLIRLRGTRGVRMLRKRVGTAGQRRRVSVVQPHESGRRISLPSSGLLLMAAGFPVRVYRAVRWRAILRSTRLRRLYYRRRAKRGPRFRAVRHRRRVRESMMDQVAQPVARSSRLGRTTVVVRGKVTSLAEARQDRPVLLALTLPLLLPYLLLRGLLRSPRHLPVAGSWIDRKVSRVAYRSLMFFHKPLMFTDYYVRAYRLVRDDEFDFFHAHDLNTLPVAAAAARTTGAKLIYDSHELYPEVSTLSRLESRVWKTLERRLIRRADQVITVCESIADELSSRYSVPKPLILLNCPPRTNLPAQKGPNVLRAATGLSETDEPIVLYQGGFATHRGLPELVEAARHFHCGILVLMGWGKLEAQLSAQIKDLGLSDRVIMIGPAAPSELASYTVGADLGVIPYQAVGLNNYYTTPNKLFEYILAGLPVAGSRFPELRRVIDGYGLGTMFDPNDPQDIALAINYMLDNPAAMAEMRANTARAADELTWENQAAKLLAAYGAITNGARVADPVPSLRR